MEQAAAAQQVAPPIPRGPGTGFTTSWSTEEEWRSPRSELQHGDMIGVGKLMGDALFFCSKDCLPSAGEHYFEVTINGSEDGAKLPNSMGANSMAVGIWAGDSKKLPTGGIKGAMTAEDPTRSGNPFWGLRGDGDKDALRVKGQGGGEVKNNTNGKAISNTDRIGVLVNMDTSEMTLYRNEQPINEGNLVRGFPKDNVRIVAQCTKGNITLAFPPKP